jgi:nucleotide-binding universal stress UspA family protein
MIVCALENGRQSSAAVAYATWLSESLGFPLRLEGVEAGRELAETVARHGARTALLVIAARPDDSDELNPILTLLGGARTPLIVLPEAASAAWEDPHRARREVRTTAVCGTDGSPSAAAAAAIAAELASGLGGRLVVAHAVDEPLTRRPASSGPRDGVSSSLFAMQRLELLQRTLAELRDCPHDFSFTELYGEPVEVLDGVGAAEAAALVAVGSRGIGKARLAVAGSISASLVRRATRPVLVMPLAAVQGAGSELTDDLAPSARA